MNENIGVVIIGRNEGTRLQRCIESIIGKVETIVYVDSGSTDNSVSYSKQKGLDVYELDMSTPFSAARARNEGFFFLMKKYPGLEFIQFIDGDCEIFENWITEAKTFLIGNPLYAIVAGQRMEKFPESSKYNLLCDIEWNTPVGDTKACGGDFLIRTETFVEINGFNPQVVAGEEPEMCYRLLKKGWKIYRYNSFMTLHDANMTKFAQWWSRAKRTGHAYAQGSIMHFEDRKGYYLKESLKDWIWALLFPAFVFLTAIFINPLLFLLLLVYPVRYIKVLITSYRKLKKIKTSAIYGLYMILANFPQIAGHILFLKRKILKTQILIIEHK